MRYPIIYIYRWRDPVFRRANCFVSSMQRIAARHLRRMIAEIVSKQASVSSTFWVFTTITLISTLRTPGITLTSEYVLIRRKISSSDISHALFRLCDSLRFYLLCSSHLAGIVMGYPTAWRWLDRVSTPILAGLTIVAMLQHSRGWAKSMPDFSLLLQGWSTGDGERVGRARTLIKFFYAHV